MKVQLQSWLEAEVIEPSDSEWSSALIAVSKKNTSAKRFCLDLRPLNQLCKKVNVYIGSIDQNLNKLHGSSCFSAFDMSSGFMAVPIAEEDRKYFSFMTPSSGSFQFCRMPFGWTNSPAIYSRFMYRLISTLPIGQVLAYVDDVLLHLPDQEGFQMVKLIDQFLTRVEASGARVQVSKSNLMQSKVTYLGYVVGSEGISMDPNYRRTLL